MPNVIDYHVIFYGSPNGYQTNRAQITLYDNKSVVAYIKFNDPGMVFENDDMLGSIICMHLPNSMFAKVLDVLRNETPISIYEAVRNGFIGSAKELVGEGE